MFSEITNHLKRKQNNYTTSGTLALHIDTLSRLEATLSVSVTTNPHSTLLRYVLTLIQKKTKGFLFTRERFEFLQLS